MPRKFRHEISGGYATPRIALGIVFSEVQTPDHAALGDDERKRGNKRFWNVLRRDTCGPRTIRYTEDHPPFRPVQPDTGCDQMIKTGTICDRNKIRGRVA